MASQCVARIDQIFAGHPDGLPASGLFSHSGCSPYSQIVVLLFIRHFFVTVCTMLNNIVDYLVLQRTVSGLMLGCLPQTLAQQIVVLSWFIVFGCTLYNIYQ
jgi:hypothetical protein